MGPVEAYEEFIAVIKQRKFYPTNDAIHTVSQQAICALLILVDYPACRLSCFVTIFFLFPSHAAEFVRRAPAEPLSIIMPGATVDVFVIKNNNTDISICYCCLLGRLLGA